MLLSMTGFGRATQTWNNKTITVEIRSLNSKIPDFRFKVPLNFKEKELEVRRIVSEKAERGKVDMSISCKSLMGEDGYEINQPVFKHYYNQLNAVADSLNLPKDDLLSSILRLPDVVMSNDNELSDEEWAAVEKTLLEALESFTKFRATEGAAMEKALNEHVSNITAHLAAVAPHEEERVGKIRQRMKQSLEDFLGRENVDKNRYEQEVLFYLEKIDISEEKVRLGQHCKYFMDELNKKDGRGRTLNFISQEMGREINTLGAKAYSSDIQHLVVKMKDELEKIKEQLANIV
jgi:uncharacterized protein (TIGR00255 family)